jgi:UDP-MurNAc hydroxylase
VETGAGSLLMDPWTAGPCEGNSWWLFPPPLTSTAPLGDVDFVYVSHIHDDHCHLPTLTQLDRRTVAVIPRQPRPWLRDVLREHGFREVLELDHGRPHELARNLRVTAFQFGRLDSALLVDDGACRVLNLNDCAIPTPLLAAELRGHRRPDVLMAAFSYASAYPVCYDIQDSDMPRLIASSRDEILEAFAARARAIGARFVVPFATQYAFLAREEFWMNASTPTPLAAIDALRRIAPEVEPVLLNPGDSLWASGKVDQVNPFDWSTREASLEREAHARAGELAAVRRAEPEAPADLASMMVDYFEGIVGRNVYLRRSLRLRIELRTERESIVIDAHRRRGSRAVAGRDETAAVRIYVPRNLVFAAITGALHWETLYLSNRLRITLRTRQCLGPEWAFWRMLFNFSRGWLADRLDFLTPRSVAVFARRRREIARVVARRLVRQSSRVPEA